MSAARPKLVQEGTPLANPPAAVGTSSLIAASSKSKYRLVIGGEADEPLPDDPERQYYDQQGYHDHQGYRGGRLDYGGRGSGRYQLHRGSGRFHSLGGRGGRYDSYRGHGYDGGRFEGGQRDSYYGTESSLQYRKKIIKDPKAPGLIKSRYVIGSDEEVQELPDEYPQEHHGTMEVEQIIPQTYNKELHQIERMEGVITLDAKEPLVVMDGANVAYAYADSLAATAPGVNRRGEPDYRGLLVASRYFQSVGVRVLIVLPAPWFRIKPNAGDHNQGNALMMTEKVEALKKLKDDGLLVAAPPRDDDDAYALTIARREHQRCTEKGEGGGYVLSNDMFRDAMARDTHVEKWLQQEWGRISFAFCDLGTKDDHGDTELDFIPNPRHPLVTEVERQRHAH